MAEVTPEAVPDEVREWLAATFTRQAVQAKREKPKFKSVANAIRTGIFFEKYFSILIFYYFTMFSKKVESTDERRPSWRQSPRNISHSFGK